MSFPTRTLVQVALLTAISIVLTRFFAVMVPIAGVLAIRLSFGEIPLILTGLLHGPWAGAVAGVMADLLGYSLFSAGGPFFPGFTLSAALTGLLPGVLLNPRQRRRPLTLRSLALAIIVTDVIVSLGLNTLWLSLMYKKAITVLLPARLLARAILVPIYIGIIYTLLRRQGRNSAAQP